MTIDHGNRGERVEGVRYGQVDPIADQFVFDRLPKPLRRYLIQAPFRLNCTEIRQALDKGQSVATIINRCELGVRGFIDAAEKQKQEGRRL